MSVLDKLPKLRPADNVRPEPRSPIYFMYSIRDMKAMNFNSPFVQLNKALAIRVFADISRDPQSTINKHPEDFDLFEVGVFDSETGLVQAYENTIYVSNANEHVQSL